MSSKSLLGCLLVMVIATVGISWAQEEAQEQAERKMANELKIKVKTDIIGMPGKGITVVPAKYASFRSTDFRNLNEKYHAIRVEEFFEEKKVGGKKEKVRVKDTYLIKFSMQGDMDIEEIARAYKKLPVVLQAEAYEREESDKK